MQIQALTKAMPATIKMLPLLATMVLSATAIKASAQNDEYISKAASDSITATAHGSMAVNTDTTKFEDAMKDSVETAIREDEPILSIQTNAGKNVHLGFNVEGTGAEEIINRVLADISLSGVGTPHAGTYKALCDAIDAMNAKGLNTQELEEEREALEDMMRDYIKDNYEQITSILDKNGTRSEFHYGENKSKVGYVTQTVQLKGNGGIKDKSNIEEIVTDSINTNTNTNTNTNNKNKFDGGVIYGLTLETENSDVRFTGDFSSDNIDLALSAENRKKLKNGTLSTALSVRETVEPDHHEGSGGASLDYKSDSNDLTTGTFAFYKYEKDKNIPADWGASVAGYLKYKNLLRLEAGDDISDGLNYVYSKLNLTGKKEIPNRNLMLTGRMSAEYGAFIFDKYLNVDPIHNVEVRTRGNLVFNPENNMNASLGAALAYSCTLVNDKSEKSLDYSHNITTSLLGNFTKDKVSISAMLSLMHSTIESFDEIGNKLDPLKVSSNVTMELKDLFRGISPFVSYTLNTGIQGLEHNIGGGVKLGIDALSQKKKTIK